MPARVSIVVPCYNGGRFLPGLMACLAAQSFRDFDVTVVDDGSTEPATQVALASLPPDVRVVAQANRGLPAARNAGIAATGGEFVLPLDCDDRLDPTFLERLVAALDGAGPDAGFAYADIRVTGAHEGVVGTQQRPFGQLFVNRLPYCLLMRRDLTLRVGGYDESLRQGYEDWEFSLRLLAADAVGVHVAAPLFLYFASPTGMLLGGTLRLHGQVWQVLRERHAALYGWPSLWRRARLQYGVAAPVAFLVGAAALTAARILPFRLQSALATSFVRGKHAVRSAMTRRREAGSPPETRP